MKCDFHELFMQINILRDFQVNCLGPKFSELLIPVPAQTEQL